MCGIYGILGFPEPSADAYALERMGHTMRHRGPDDDGAHSDPHIHMGMRRLAVIDVEGGQQPIFNEDRTVVAICNGEIYNYQSLRSDLIARGHTFTSASDTEVIVHLYEEYGPDMVTYLRGMFAFAIWDSRQKQLVLARDRLGIKPLYVAEQPNGLIFASELKSILEVSGQPPRIDQAALHEYLSLGYVPGPYSMIKGVHKLMPGSYLIANEGGRRTKKYWSICHEAQTEISEDEWSQRIADTIEEAVVSQMVSDVPLGAFLSGGIDSSAVVAFMARSSDRPVKTYSIGFDVGVGGEYYNELPYARQVATQFQTDHREIIVRPDVARLLPELLWYLDEPIADAAFLTTYLVSKFAREDVTVILSGVGGDELFGGYRRYWSDYIASIYLRLPAALRHNVLQPLARKIPGDRHSRILDWFRLVKGFMAGAELEADERYESHMRVFGASEMSDLLSVDAAQRSETMIRAFEQVSSSQSLERMIEVDLQTQLPDDLLMLTDRMSMATSLECRVPLLDEKLVDLAMELPPHMKVHGTGLKIGLKAAMRDVLPGSIVDRKKRGFGAPIGGWFKQDLSRFLDGVLSRSAIEERGLVDWSTVSNLKEKHQASREDYTDHLLALVNLELWCQLYLDGTSTSTVAEKLETAVAA